MPWLRRDRHPASATGERARPNSFEAYLVRNEAGERYALLQLVFSALAALSLLALSIVTNSQAAGLMLAFPLVFFGYAFERWQEARGGRESLRQDVIALSNVLYQDAALIDKILEDDMIDEYLQNLLSAALKNEEFGGAYWAQAVRPFLRHASDEGFREDWRYCIDLADLSAPVALSRDEAGGPAIEPAEFWGLTTTASYRQDLRHLRSEYYVGCTFSLDDLPEWFRDTDFLLRELVSVNPDHISAVAAASTDEWIGRDCSDRDAEVWRVAETLLGCKLRINRKQIAPDALQANSRGIRWRFPAPADLEQGGGDPVPVRIELRSFQPRTQEFFPVNITLPTRHPTVQFSYGRTSLDPERVGANVFFSAEEPYRPELVEHNDAAKRLEVNTNRDEWVFAGSGCMFVWQGE